MRSETGMSPGTFGSAPPAGGREAVVVPLPATSTRARLSLPNGQERARSASVTWIRSNPGVDWMPAAAETPNGEPETGMLTEVEWLLHAQIEAHLAEIERADGDAPRSVALVRRSLSLLMRLRGA